MNNNHYYRPTLTGNKNRRRVQESNFGALLKLYSNKNVNQKSSLLFHGSYISTLQNIIDSQDIDTQFNQIYRSINVPNINGRSASKSRAKTEIDQSNLEFNYSNQKVDQSTAYFPRLKDRASSEQKKLFKQKALNSENEDSSLIIRNLQKSLDYKIQPYRRQNFTPLKQQTIDVPRSLVKSEHLNEKEIMQFSFGLQYNRENIEKQKAKFPKDIFLGDVRRVKRIFQQQ
ncbi:unnamed protein product (macronuclear) [Paramecium tetraurelia]|uniref:Uncharacterized protein n=1 Tax=Paramecium tetraurelia TaxID=5888 RepID=A0CDP1_PARTE|nr:uncharacterized protein GSPATT00007120001 [Paramecium tetraurelia]CAK68908.1 unnamed protein product [Paramecium tetraurelia]|eukprot:XP_001436305.1 hypothetical protein (macronuclear) [Paramecium tetraurelia strain d4-2]